MARIRITGPDGRTVVLNAPDGASNEQIQQKINALKTQWGAPSPEVTETGAPQVSRAESLGRGALQGVTFGFGDELYGAGAGAVDWLQGEGFNYQKNRDEVRAANEAAQKANPGTYLIGEIGAGVAMPFGAAGLAARGGRLAQAARTTGFAPELAAGTVGGRAVQGARMGAAYGGAYGLGTSNEETVGGNIGETLKGVASGAVLGGVASPVIDAAAAIARPIRNAGMGAINPRRAAAEKYAENAARDVGGSATPGEVAQAIDVTNARAQRAGRIDPQTRLMDVGGENTKGLMRQAFDMPNDRSQSVKRMLDSRQDRQWRDIERALAQTVGDPEAHAQAVGDIITRRGQQAAQNFEQAFAVDTPMTDRLRAVLERPTMRELHQLTSRRLADEGAAIGLENRTRQLHRIKLEIDSQIGAARRAQATGQRPQAGWDLRTLQTLKRDLLAAIDNPAYRQALDNYAGESAMINAAEDGFENALRMAPEEIRPLIEGMTAGEQAMWRSGAARAIAGRIERGNVTNDLVEKLFSSPDMKRRMLSIWPDRASLLRFRRVLEAKRSQSSTRKALQGNSKTSANLARASEAGEPMRAAVTAAQAATGRIEPLMNAIGRVGNRFSGLTPATANALLEIGSRPAAQGLNDDVLRALAQYGQAPGRRAAAGRGLASALIGPVNQDRQSSR